MSKKNKPEEIPSWIRDLYKEDLDRVVRGERPMYFRGMDDSPLRNVSPEFDILSGGDAVKGMNGIRGALSPLNNGMGNYNFSIRGINKKIGELVDEAGLYLPEKLRPVYRTVVDAMSSSKDKGLGHITQPLANALYPADERRDRRLEGEHPVGYVDAIDGIWPRKKYGLWGEKIERKQDGGETRESVLDRPRFGSRVLDNYVASAHPVLSIIYDIANSRYTDGPTRINKAAYSSIDPMGKNPEWYEYPVHFMKMFGKYISGDFNNKLYGDSDNDDLGTRTSDEAWAKYNKLPYDESVLIDNGDGTYSIRKELSNRMIPDSSIVRNRIDVNRSLFDKETKEYNEGLIKALSDADPEEYERIQREYKDLKRVREGAISADEMNIKGLRSLYDKGYGVVNEYNYRDRRLDKNETGPHSVLGDYTIYRDKDMGGYRYRDVYDFNPAVQFLLNGDVFKIDGSIDKKDRGGSVNTGRAYGSGKYVIDPRRSEDSKMAVYDEIWDYLTDKKGIPQTQAIGILSNIAAESGGDTEALGAAGDFGIQQWLGPRKKELQRRYGKKPTLTQQLDYLVDEYQGKVPGLGWNYINQGKFFDKDAQGNIYNYYMYSKADFDNATNYKDATVAWNQGYGRPLGSTLRNEKRFEFADMFSNRYGVPENGLMRYEFGQRDSGTGDGGHQPVPETVAPAGPSLASHPAVDSWWEKEGQDLLYKMLAQSGANKKAIEDIANNIKNDPQSEAQIAEAERMRKEQAKRQLVLNMIPRLSLNIKGMSRTRN